MQLVERLSRPQAYLFLANTVSTYKPSSGETRRKINLRDGIPFWDILDPGTTSQEQIDILNNSDSSLQLIEAVNKLLELDQPEKPRGKSKLQFRVRERLVLILRYGLGNGKPLSQTEIARELKTTQAHIYILEETALWRLRQPQNLQRLQAFLP